MWFLRFMRSVPGRVARVMVGLSLIAYGSHQVSLLGLVMMMVGIVPAVTGAAGVSLIEEVIRSRELTRLPAGHPHEHRA